MTSTVPPALRRGALPSRTGTLPLVDAPAIVGALS